MSKLRVGVIGTGHMGLLHVKCVLASDLLELSGFLEPDDARAQEVISRFGAVRFFSLEDLAAVSDIMDIVSPTATHFDFAAKAMRLGKHVFIEKPLTSTLEEANSLIEIAKQTGMKAQSGHIERYNPAYLRAKKLQPAPMFIEGHRLAMFKPRGTDVSVVLDMMIHDLDLLLDLTQSEPIEVQASGVSVLSDTADIANARIVFANGCVANLTASRLSLKTMRKLRLFNRESYMGIDLLEKKIEHIKILESSDSPYPLVPIETMRGTKYIAIEQPEIESLNALVMELEALAKCILNDTPPEVSLTAGRDALQLAFRIQHAMDVGSQKTIL